MCIYVSCLSSGAKCVINGAGKKPDVRAAVVAVLFCGGASNFAADGNAARDTHARTEGQRRRSINSAILPQLSRIYVMYTYRIYF